MSGKRRYGINSFKFIVFFLSKENSMGHLSSALVIIPIYHNIT